VIASRFDFTSRRTGTCFFPLFPFKKFYPRVYSQQDDIKQGSNFLFSEVGNIF